MFRPRKGDQVDRDVGVLARLEVAHERRQHGDEHDERRERDEADDPLRRRRHTRFTSGLPKIPCGPDEQDDEDDEERHRQPQLLREPVEGAVLAQVAEQVEEHADQQAADDGAERRVDAAEHGGGEGVDENGRHHVRIEPDRGRGEHPGDRTEKRSQAPAEREHPRDAHADEPGLLRIDRRGPQREPDLRELEEHPEEEDDPERDGDRPDVVSCDDDAADVVRLGPERALQLLRLAAPLPDDEAVDRDEEADRDDHDPQDAPALDRADDRAVDPDAADEREASVATNAGQ